MECCLKLIVVTPLLKLHINYFHNFVSLSKFVNSLNVHATWGATWAYLSHKIHTLNRLQEMHVHKDRTDKVGF